MKKFLIKSTRIVDKLSEEDINKIVLLQSIRKNISEELDAIDSYENNIQLADELGYENVVSILNSIRNEERVHLGELQKLLQILDPQEQSTFKEGQKEAEKELLNKE